MNAITCAGVQTPDTPSIRSVGVMEVIGCMMINVIDND